MARLKSTFLVLCPLAQGPSVCSLRGSLRGLDDFELVMLRSMAWNKGGIWVLLLLKLCFHVIIEFVNDLCMLCVDVHADHFGVAFVVRFFQKFAVQVHFDLTLLGSTKRPTDKSGKAI